MTLPAISHIQSPSPHVDLERIENLQALSLSRHAVKRAAERLCVEGRDTHHGSRGRGSRGCRVSPRNQDRSRGVNTYSKPTLVAWIYAAYPRTLDNTARSHAPCLPLI